ncbi:uncharacterized protein K441DRAFT_693580 [Cenococcum geophilum 1.58]|uniref:uncharacterized protein n=1 Tax=Cenococcum geophilum 1.58 TaxID=794803 RepID=UPI00358ED2F8|nr:hypothetical protein K441DRAFT_693580 [Cenococcum geophilum 1.58]
MARDPTGSTDTPDRGALTRAQTVLNKEPTISNLVWRFVQDEYSPEHYRKCAQKAKELCEEKLKGESVQARFSFRPKDRKRLLQKLKTRDEKVHYADPKEIMEDIVDLAGVRIILYMPSQIQRDTVKTIIKSIFGDKPPDFVERPHDPKELPEPRKSGYRPRNLGYTAEHYRVRMKPDHGTEKYDWKATDMVEIQVVSAMTHAWAEAGHDILYKSMEGVASVEEERILDALNGLVQSGDLLLEQLHHLVMARTRSRFGNKHRLGAYLDELQELKESNRAKEFKEDLDIFQKFLEVQKKDYPLAVRNAFKGLKFPKDQDLELKKIMKKYAPFTPNPSMDTMICLIDHILSESDADEIAAGKAHEKKSLAKEPEVMYRCKIMVSAVMWLQKFSRDRTEVEDAFHRCEITSEERLGLQYVLTGWLMPKILAGGDANDREIIEKDGILDQLDSAWAWFENDAGKQEKRSICGLAFRIAKMGVLKDLPAELHQLEKVSLTSD